MAVHGGAVQRGNTVLSFAYFPLLICILYIGQVMREADIDDMGLKIGGRNISNMRYADDTGLVGGNVTSSRRILHRVDTAGKVAGLGLNVPKTEYLHIAPVCDKQV